MHFACDINLHLLIRRHLGTRQANHFCDLVQSRFETSDKTNSNENEILDRFHKFYSIILNTLY